MEKINKLLDREHEFNYFIRPKNDEDNPLKSSEKKEWKTKGIQEIELEQFIQDQFRLPIQTVSKEGKLLISIKKSVVSVNQKSSTLTQTHAEIAKKLIDKNGEKLANSKLHTSKHTSVYISKINTQLERDCELKYFPFINKEGTSCLDSKHYFAE